MNLKYALAVAALTIGAATHAHASLILMSPAPFSGTGLGAVNTILTLTSPGNLTTESGCVGFGDLTGTAACFGGAATGGDELTGTSQTQPRTVAQSGAASAFDFAIVLNAQEPGNVAANSITVDNLAVRFFSPTGTTLFTASLAAPVTLPNTFTGTGNAGFVFTLDAAQAADAETAGAFADQMNVIGLSASLSNATGGPETFFVTSIGENGGGGIGNPIPEPVTYLTLAAGLLALGAFRKRLVRQ